MKFSKSSARGQALIVIALAAVALFGFVGLAIDGTAKFSDRRHAQNAADTAALAAALAKVNELADSETDSSITTTPAECPPSGGMSVASDVCVELMLTGLNRAADNGYDSANSTVVINSPPKNGYYATVGNKDEYVEVIITSHVQTTFMRIFGVTQSDNIVSAVAYAKPGKNLADGAMIIAYDDSPNCSTGGTGGYSVSVSGSSIVNLNGGGILLNSDEVCGFTIPNCADLNIYGGTVNSVTNNVDTGACTFDPPLTPNIDPDLAINIPDDVYWPDVPPECSLAPASPTLLGYDMTDSFNPHKGEWLIYPGYYEEFPPTDLVGNKQHIYMASGVYCIDPRGPSFDTDLSWSPTDFVSLNGSTVSNPSQTSYNKYHTYNPDGVTLYIKSGGGFTLNANNPTFIDSSTDGDYQGYLIILEGNEASIESCSITGGNNVNFNGMIFAPYCDITVNGGSDPTAEINAQLIGWDIKINGTTTINFHYNPDNQVRIKRHIGLLK
jgi:Flp pilus assembly protein TadG